MKISEEQYSQMVKQASPKPNLTKNCLWAFFVGGSICTVGEILQNVYLSLDFTKDEASLLVSSSLVAVSAILTALGLYHKIATKAGAGTLVPITGFANAVVSPAIEFKCEGFIMGVGAKMLVIAGPVIVYGVLASVGCGSIYYLINFYF